MEIKLGNIEVVPVNKTTQRFNALIWGTSGCGKTTLASTAPGKKLWLLFDPDGDVSLKDVNNNEDCLVVNLTKESKNIVAQLAAENCMGLEKFITENNIDTIIFDSITTYLNKCLQLAVVGINNASEMNPGLKGYGNRKYYLEKTLNNLINVTAKTNTNIIFLAHEDKPTLNSDGAVDCIMPLLGGSSSASVPIVISEVWHLSNNGKEYRIRVKQNAIRKPMKTRMFDESVSDFVWKYTPKQGGVGISDWLNKWREENKKIMPF